LKRSQSIVSGMFLSVQANSVGTKKPLRVNIVSKFLRICRTSAIAFVSFTALQPLRVNVH
jgi:hypothetical protein